MHSIRSRTTANTPPRNIKSPPTGSSSSGTSCRLSDWLCGCRLAAITTTHGSSARRACSSVPRSWAGMAGRPCKEKRRRSFSRGPNFSVHDTHVIAGGRDAVSVLVSRNVLEVTIAKDAAPAPSVNGTPLLDITVATPNGISNHLLIPMSGTRSQPVRFGGKEPRPLEGATDRVGATART